MQQKLDWEKENLQAQLKAQATTSKAQLKVLQNRIGELETIDHSLRQTLSTQAEQICSAGSAREKSEAECSRLQLEHETTLKQLAKVQDEKDELGMLLESSRKASKEATD